MGKWQRGRLKRGVKQDRECTIADDGGTTKRKRQHYSKPYQEKGKTRARNNRKLRWQAHNVAKDSTGFPNQSLPAMLCVCVCVCAHAICLPLIWADPCQKLLCCQTHKTFVTYCVPTSSPISGMVMRPKGGLQNKMSPSMAAWAAGLQLSHHDSRTNSIQNYYTQWQRKVKTVLVLFFFSAQTSLIIAEFKGHF